MISWNRYSLDQITQKWYEFKSMRIKKHAAMKYTDKKQITCLERETLIEHLLQRLKNAQKN